MNDRKKNKENYDRLREVVLEVMLTISHWPELGSGVGWNPLIEPHSKWCPPCKLKAALT